MGDAAPDVGAALSECNYQSLSHPHSPKFLEHSPVSLHSLRKGFPELCLGSGSSFCAIRGDGSSFTPCCTHGEQNSPASHGRGQPKLPPLWSPNFYQWPRPEQQMPSMRLTLSKDGTSSSLSLLSPFPASPEPCQPELCNAINYFLPQLLLSRDEG